MNYKSELICHMCHLVVDDHVSLPCHCVICKVHLYDGPIMKEFIACNTCGDEFCIPPKGFKSNKLIDRILANDGHLSEEEKRLKQRMYTIHSQLEQLLSMFALNHANVSAFSTDHFAEVRRKIDLHRELIKQKIDDIALDMIDQTKAEEAKLMQTLANAAAQPFTVNVLNEPKTLAAQFRQVKVPMETIQGQVLDQEKKLVDLQAILNELEVFKVGIKAFQFKENHELASRLFGDLKLRPVVTQKLLSFSDRATLRVWDMAPIEYMKTLAVPINTVICMEVIDPTRIVCSSFYGKLQIWDVNEDKCVKNFVTTPLVWVLCLKAITQNRIAIGSENSIQIWNMESVECIQRLQNLSARVNCLAYSPNGKLISGSNDNTIKVWDLDSGECLSTLIGHLNPVFCLLMLENGHLASGSFDAAVRIWNLESGQCIRKLSGHTSTVNCLEVKKTGELVSCSDDRTIKVWNIHTGDCIRTVTDTFHVTCVRMCLNGTLLSGSADGSVKLWNLDTGACISTWFGHQKSVTELKFVYF